MDRRLKICLWLLILLSMGGCRLWDKGGPLTFSGTVEVTEHALSFPVPARIAAVNIEEGQPVRRGDLLAVTDRYEQVRKDLDRAVALFESGGVDEQTIEHARLAAADQRIESPVDGEVLVKVRHTGETAAAGSSVLIVGETDRPWIRVFVPEGRLQQVRIGQKARVRLDGGRADIEGEVFYISPKAEFTPRNVQTAEERITQTFLVKVRIAGGREVHPGVFADVTLDPAA